MNRREVLNFIEYYLVVFKWLFSSSSCDTEDQCSPSNSYNLLQGTSNIKCNLKIIMRRKMVSYSMWRTLVKKREMLKCSPWEELMKT